MCKPGAHSAPCGAKARQDARKTRWWPMTKSSETPQNPSLNGLVALSNRSGVDIRPTLLRVVTDLYLRSPVHSEKEEVEYTRMALRLLDHVDGKTRAMIAEKIAGYPNAP